MVDIDVPAGHEPPDVIGLAEVEHRPLRQVFQVLLICACRVEGREFAGRIRAEDVARHPRAVAHRDVNVTFNHHFVLRAAQPIAGEVLREHGGHDLRLEDLRVHPLASWCYPSTMAPSYT